jgi:N6-L-threonylcarbamoyladenine synthase
MAAGNKDKNILNKETIVLGIETSCDDTCAAVVKNGREIVSSVISSQNEIHEKYGGVVPEIASRKHIEMIDIVIKEALLKAVISPGDIDIVAVTNRPGLLGSLLTGVGAAKGFCYYSNTPLVAVNHLKAHIFANVLAFEDIDFSMPGRYVSLIVSGGHSSIYIVNENLEMNEIGHTVDDAVGEAFDKIARYLGLGYPGGPVIDRISKNADPHFIEFTRPMIDSGDFNFSFSGIKTALIYRTKKFPELMLEKNLPDLCASFQAAAVDVLVSKTIKACLEFKLDRILISGGVAANSRLRSEFIASAADKGIKAYIPPVSLCMDNAAMVASLGYFEFKRGNVAGLDIDVFSRTDF